MLSPTSSPWIHQLNREREAKGLSDNTKADIAIIGGGIAGITTAYHILRDTPHSVLLLEADKVAHGATGHNAGQITSYFERPFASLVSEFGLELAVDAQASVESGWEVLARMQDEIGLKTPFWKFTGYAGCTNLEQILLYLEDIRLKAEGGLGVERMYIATEHISSDDIPDQYESLYHMVSHEYILELLDTDNPVYVGVMCYDKGCTNSAVLCEEVVGYLLATYPNRFSLAEETPVKQVVMGENSITLHTNMHTLSVSHVVMCTNGFEKIELVNENNSGLDMNAKFHHQIEGKIGYMAAFLESEKRDPVAISYFPESGADPEAPYFYLTRRPYSERGLLSVGGPDRDLAKDASYARHEPFEESEFKQIENFVEKNVRGYSPTTERELFLWHGLMGYTPNRIRIVGSDPHTPNLLYNLGCNGVGILPSLFGATRITEILLGTYDRTSIFDPK